ncbi:MAG: sigma-54 dependent transcriptional regulator [Deltaproteobacteria bacterium]|jgi:DNA-binding NtrC family response regulator|nr:sigma-54 dependent transcriptional regulator [Deltaproteobacteria bacterium]
MKSVILLIDCDRNYRQTCKIVLQGFGFEVVTAETGLRGAILATENSYDLIMMDLRFAEIPALELLAFIKCKSDRKKTAEIKKRCGDLTSDSLNRNTPVIILTALKTDEESELARQSGAVEVLLKGVDNDVLKLKIEQAIAESATSVSYPHELGDGIFLGDNPVYKKILNFIDKIAESNKPVLITGESGVGKEVIARLIWQKSSRGENVFRVCNCTGVTKEMVEDTLFGHTKGAFTGATSERKGLLKSAQGGTVFLDEIAETGLDFQAKLLRALQFGEIQTVGSDVVEYVNVRFLAATNRDLAKEIVQSRFRHDLYYRFTFTIHVPPLRERVDDLPRLASYLLTKAAVENLKPVQVISDEAMKAICAYTWPGNIRQLQNALEYSSVMAAGSEIGKDDLPDYISGVPRADYQPQSLEEIEKQAILDTLRYTAWVKTKAAKILEITPKTLRDKLEKYKVVQPVPVGKEEVKEDGAAADDSELDGEGEA